MKSFPVLSGGFEIETELAVHALELELAVAEVDTPYYARPEGSVSKLQHLAGWFPHSAHHRQPLSLGAAACVLLRHRRRAGGRLHQSRGTDLPDLFRAGLVPRLPTAVLSTGMMLLACLSVVVGLVLDTVTQADGAR